MLIAKFACDFISQMSFIYKPIYRKPLTQRQKLLSYADAPQKHIQFSGKS